VDYEEIAGVVVEDGEGVDAPAGHLEEALEVALPQLVGAAALEALGRGLRWRGRVDPAVAFEDGRQGADARQDEALSAEQGVDLAGPPAEVVAGLEDGFGDGGRCARGRGVRAAGVVIQGLAGVGAVAVQPLVAGLAAMPKARQAAWTGVLRDRTWWTKAERISDTGWTSQGIAHLLSGERYTE
jgi:hypothetical protein